MKALYLSLTLFVLASCASGGGYVRSSYYDDCDQYGGCYYSRRHHEHRNHGHRGRGDHHKGGHGHGHGGGGGHHKH